jgi:hypothetical protein
MLNPDQLARHGKRWARTGLQRTLPLARSRFSQRRRVVIRSEEPRGMDP